MKKFAFLSLSLLASFFFAAACGGGKSSTSGNAQLRVVNASPATYNILLAGATFGSNVAFNGASAYTAETSGSKTIEFRGTTGSTADVIDQSITLAAGSNYTYVAMGTNVVAGVLFTDQNTAAGSGNFDLRIINGSSFYGPLDIYVVPTTGSCYNNNYLYTVSANIAGLNLGGASAYKSFATGSYQLCVTQPNSKTAVLATGYTAYKTGQVVTIIIDDAGQPPLYATPLTDVAGS